MIMHRLPFTRYLRKAKQTIKYILKGCGIETYQPHFTFQGFRYVKVEGYPGELKPENFTGMVIHSDMEVTGNFRCSDKLVNQLQHNILWGQKGNFLDVPTDCPQRDERLGWTGDAQMFIRTACFNMNVALFFTKWLRDLYAEQSAEKGVPFVIPHVLGENDYSSSAWGDASTICPWTIYTCYGDRRILEEQYESMKMWVEYIRAQGDNEYLWNTGFHFGDWVGLDAKPDSYVGATSRDFIATAFYACSASIVAKAAGVLGKNEDRAEYEKLHANIVKNFREEFVSPNGRLVSPTQTAHVLALMFGLVEEKHRKRTVEALVGLIEENKCHLDTGFVGTPYICHVLSENGHNDLAYWLLLQKDYPSWLYQVTKGATTIWEHWDGIKEDGSFWSPDMNSFNHYAYGSIGDWLYRVAAGIDAGKPGYKHIYIRPRPGNGLTFVEASLDSPYGVIKSAWKKDGDALEIRVTIPANTTASIILPFAKQDAVYESGKKLQCSEGVTVSKQTDNGLMLELVSGQYLFTYLYSLS
jgi:alpha-L-rhamnosidase